MSILSTIQKELVAKAAKEGKTAAQIAKCSVTLSGVNQIDANVFDGEVFGGYNGPSVAGQVSQNSTFSANLDAISMFDSEQVTAIKNAADAFSLKADYMSNDGTVVATLAVDGSLAADYLPNMQVNNAKGSYGLVGGKQFPIGEAA